MVRPRVALALLALAAFACEDEPTGPRFGYVQLFVQTTGFDADDRYEITSDTIKLDVRANESLTFQMPTGSRSFELKGVADNCLVDGSSTAPVTISKNDTAHVLFKVGCAATGITITTQTAGGDLPAVFQVSAPPLPTFNISPNGTQSFTRVAVGRYQVRLTTGVSHCSVNGDSIVTVDVVNRQITSIQFNVQCVLAARTGSIAFVDYTRAELAVVNPDGSGLGSLNFGYDPSWSRDGKKIVYSVTQCDYYSYICSGSLALLDPITRQKEILDRAPLGYTPDWSPTDDVIAYINASTNRLFLYNVATGANSEVPIPATLVYHPSWSADGTQLVAQCWDPDHGSQLCIFNRDGSGFRYLTNEFNSYFGSPSWSPDGSQIVFTKCAAGCLISVMKPDGTGFRQLVPGGNAAWSPDSREIIFGTQSGLTIIRDDGLNSRRITTGNHGNPSWRP
jgi:hypothetical protein